MRPIKNGISHLIDATLALSAWLCIACLGLVARALFDSVCKMFPCDVLVCLETMSRV